MKDKEKERNTRHDKKRGEKVNSDESEQKLHL